MDCFDAINATVVIQSDIVQLERFVFQFSHGQIGPQKWRSSSGLSNSLGLTDTNWVYHVSTLKLSNSLLPHALFVLVAPTHLPTETERAKLTNLPVFETIAQAIGINLFLA